MDEVSIGFFESGELFADSGFSTFSGVEGSEREPKSARLREIILILVRDINEFGLVKPYST